MRKRILEQPIDVINTDEAIQLVKSAILQKRQFKIVTLNSEMVMKAYSNFELQAAINNAHLVIPDTIGIIWALKFLDSSVSDSVSRVPGIEFAEKILEIANYYKKKVVLFGSKKEVLEKAVIEINKKYPNIFIVKSIDGYQGEINDAKIAHEIASLSPDIVLVALGIPRQEIWINKFESLFSHSLMIGIGGSFDIWSGTKHRAPQWVRNIYLEWLFRSIIDPKRIPRILKTLPSFILLVLKKKLQLYLN